MLRPIIYAKIFTRTVMSQITYHILLRVSRTTPRIARRENSNVRCRRYFWFVEFKWSEAYARKYFWNSETSTLEEAAKSETESELIMVTVPVTNLTEGFWLIKVFEDFDSNKRQQLLDKKLWGCLLTLRSLSRQRSVFGFFNPFVTSRTYMSHLQRVFSSPLS
jgi:hypothetical protein